MMRGQQSLVRLEVRCERGIAGLARRGLQARAPRRVEGERNHPQRNARRGAGLAAGFRPGRRTRLQSVIDVDGAQPDFPVRGPSGHCVKQHAGVEAAGECDASAVMAPSGIGGGERGCEAFGPERHGPQAPP